MKEEGRGMLKDFYRIESLNEASGIYTCGVMLNAVHEVYGGHFPEMPVAPGVCMLQVIKECVSGVLKKPMRYASIRECKFLAVVNPERQPLLTVVFSLKEDKALQATVSQEGLVVLKLKATLIAE